jgi:predicted nucleic-acid-binding protein
LGRGGSRTAEGATIFPHKGTKTQNSPALLNVPTIVMADEEAVRQALVAFAKRGDFADYIHLVAARVAEAFVTFNQRMIGTPGIAVEVVC